MKKLLLVCAAVLVLLAGCGREGVEPPPQDAADSQDSPLPEPGETGPSHSGIISQEPQVPAESEEDAYVGIWRDPDNSQCHITITCGGGTQYGIEIYWCGGEGENIFWALDPIRK